MQKALTHLNYQCPQSQAPTSNYPKVSFLNIALHFFTCQCPVHPKQNGNNSVSAISWVRLF